MIAFLAELSKQNGGIATWKQLQEFRFQGRQIPLIGQKGIRNGHESAFTILTTYRLNPKTRPYDDAIVRMDTHGISGVVKRARIRTMNHSANAL